MRTALQKYLESVRFKHIDQVIEAFKLCENSDDVQEVIAEIPRKFGDFYFELTDDNGNAYDIDDPATEEIAQRITGFRVTNTYWEYDDEQEDKYDFNWYED